jgi:hypothetical protein
MPASKVGEKSEMIKSPLHKFSPKNGMHDPVHELCDGERETISYWVGEITTPQHAAMLLEEHGGPPEEEWSNPYNPYKKRAGDEEE